MNKITGIVILNWMKFRKIFQFRPHDITNAEGKSHERYRRILLTGGSTAVVKIFAVGINLITVPLTVNYLGAERYGLWMAISSVMALMGFADLGLGNGLLNAVSRANGRNSAKDAQVAVSSTFFLLLGISCFLLIIFISVFPFISWKDVFNVKSALAIRESGPTMMVLVVILLINMPLGVIQRIQDGYQEGYRFQVWLILGSLLSFVGLLICVYLKSGLTWLVFAYSAGQLVATSLNGLYLFNRKRKYLKPSLKYFNWEVGKSLVRSGLIFFLLGLFTLLANASDDLIITQTLGPSTVAGYEIVKKLFLFSMFTQYLIQPLWPAFTEAMESGDIAWAKNTIKKGLLISIISTAIISLPLLLFGKQIITIWVSPQYIPSWSLLLGFYLFVLLGSYGGVMSTFLNSGPLLQKQLIIVGLAGISSVLLKIFFALNFGVSGIIWATIAGYSLFYVFPSYKLAFNYLNSKIIASKIKML
ncbi:MAG: oligosaccharide flippase family protein [Bacteroidota bacterium]|nr:oligosaccharide flippase family protein [Bacteroidota bacterium]